MKTTEDETINEIKSTKLTLRVLNMLFLVLAVLFMFVYFDKHDLVFGLAGVLSFGYWCISQLVFIVTAFFISIRQLKDNG